MDRPPQSPSRRFTDPTVWVFVSVYLIVLAVFAVLYQVSEQKTARAAAAMESLDTTFQRLYPAPTRATGPVPPDEAAAADPRFFRRADEIAASMLAGVPSAGPDSPNSQLIALDSHALFFDDAARLSAQAAPFFDALASLLADAPAGRRREALFLFGQEGEEGGLAHARAERLARALAAAGAPETAFAVGLRDGLTGRDLQIELRAIRHGETPAGGAGAGAGERG